MPIAGIMVVVTNFTETAPAHLGIVLFFNAAVFPSPTEKRLPMWIVSCNFAVGKSIIRR